MPYMRQEREREREGDEEGETEERESRSHIGACRPPHPLVSCSSRAHKTALSLAMDDDGNMHGQKTTKRDERSEARDPSIRGNELHVHPEGKKSIRLLRFRRWPCRVNISKSLACSN